MTAAAKVLAKLKLAATLKACTRHGKNPVVCEKAARKAYRA
jgi:hypothetical protein